MIFKYVRVKKIRVSVNKSVRWFIENLIGCRFGWLLVLGRFKRGGTVFVEVLILDVWIFVFKVVV